MDLITYSNTARTDVTRLRIAAFLYILAFITWTACTKENAPMDAIYQQVLVEAQKSGKNVLIVFGADWCLDCKALQRIFQEEQAAAILKKHFIVLHVDVCEFDCNMDFAKRMGNPEAKGIPALAVTDANGKLLASTNNGQFASARSMQAQALTDYLQKFTPEMH